MLETWGKIDKVARLYIEDPRGRVKQLELEEEEVTVGRAEDNTVVLPQRNVSRHHLRIFRKDGQWFLEDRGSRYGTSYDGSPVEGTIPIRPGAFIEFAGYRLKVIDPQAAVTETVESPKVSDIFAPDEEETEVLNRDEVFGDEWTEEFVSEKKPRRWGLIVGGVLGLVVLAGIGVFVLGSGGSKASRVVKTRETKKEVVKSGTRKVTPIKKKVVIPKVASFRDQMAHPMLLSVRGLVAVPIPKELAVRQRPSPRPRPKAKRIRGVSRQAKKIARAKKEISQKKEENSGSVRELLHQAITQGSVRKRIDTLKLCIRKYGGACCRAHKLLAVSYEQLGLNARALQEWRKYAGCATTAKEKLKAQQRIQRLEGL